MGAKVFNRPDELVVARKLVDGCIWAYERYATLSVATSTSKKSDNSQHAPRSHARSVLYRPLRKPNELSMGRREMEGGG